MYGDMVGLLAVVLLFVVGWQVYFVVGINRRIERLEDRLDRLELSRLEACHYSQLGMADACMAKNDYVGGSEVLFVCAEPCAEDGCSA